MKPGPQAVNFEGRIRKLIQSDESMYHLESKECDLRLFEENINTS